MNNDGTRPEEDLTGDARSIFPTTTRDAQFLVVRSSECVKRIVSHI